MPLIRKLIIDWGDLGGLTALALSDRPENLVLWHPVVDDEATERRRQTALEHATIFNVEEFIEAPLGAVLPGLNQPRESRRAEGSELNDAVLGLIAARAAIESHCGAVLWTLHCGGDYEGVARICEQATLIGHLADTARGMEPLQIETPFINHKDDELIELAMKAGAPLRATWWCRHNAVDPCGGCDSCLRWFKAADQAGVTLPWQLEPPRG